MKMEDKLVAPIISGPKVLYEQNVPAAQIQLQRIKKEFEEHLTLVVFPSLRMSKKGPEQTAQEIGEYLKANELAVAVFNVIKGFLNLAIASATWIELLNEIHADAQYGTVSADGNVPLVMIEHSSSNTNKPLHLGHMRNNLLGNVLVSIVVANGNKVAKTNIVDDRGIHIYKSMLVWQKYDNGETLESSGREGDHLVGGRYVTFDKHHKAEVAELMEKSIAKEKVEAASPLVNEAREMLVRWGVGGLEVRALWQMMNNWAYEGFDETYRGMGVGFNKIYYGSSTYPEGKEKVMEDLEKSFSFKKGGGSIQVDLTAEGLDHKPLLHRDGTSIYITQDAGTAKLHSIDHPISKMIYVVENEQNYHSQVLSILLDKLGFERGKSLAHSSYGMVELPGGKIKSCEGTVVNADDLMAEMITTVKETSQELGKLGGLTQEEADDTVRIAGLGVLKHSTLKMDTRKNMTFSPKESIDFDGNADPFIQYTYARIQSILRRTAEADIVILQVLPANIELSEEEEGLIRVAADLTAVVHQAGEDYSPSGIANYVYDLVEEYNQFYHDFSILRGENESVKLFRVTLPANTAKVVRLGMGLLGIEAPNRM